MGNSKDWFNFFLTFTATVAGASVGVLGLRWQFHRESRERYETQLTDRLFRVNEEMREMVAGAPSFGRNPTTDVWDMFIALNNVSMMAKGADRELVSLLGDACSAQNSSGQKEVSDLFGFLIGIITGWRSQTNSFDYFLGRVKERIGREKPENKESIPPVS